MQHTDCCAARPSSCMGVCACPPTHQLRVFTTHVGCRRGQSITHTNVAVPTARTQPDGNCARTPWAYLSSTTTRNIGLLNGYEHRRAGVANHWLGGSGFDENIDHWKRKLASLKAEIPKEDALTLAVALVALTLRAVTSQSRISTEPAETVTGS